MTGEYKNLTNSVHYPRFFIWIIGSTPPMTIELSHDPRSWVISIKVDRRAWCTNFGQANSNGLVFVRCIAIILKLL